MSEQTNGQANSGSVRIRLTTREDELKVDDAPIYVPVDLKRYGLSEVVNQLLDTVEPVPFDFLVDGKLLRGSLNSYLTANALSTETVLTLEYVRSILPPSFLASFLHEDWVSSVHIDRSSGSESRASIATGSYDGIVRLWDDSGNVQHQLAGHTGAVKALKWLGSRKIISGGADRNLCLWKLGESEEGPSSGAKIACIFAGHKGAINDVVGLKSDKIVSAGADNQLLIWTSRIKDLPPPPATETSKFTSTQKRRKLAEQARASSKVRGALGALEGHKAPVTAVTAHPKDPEVVYSASEDHTIRTWDLVTQTLVDTKTTSYSLLSLASLGPTTSLLACGSSARHILLLDPRAEIKTSQQQLSGHKNFVVDIVPSPTNAYQFASGSHDGTVRVWDVRANNSLFVLDAEGDKGANDVLALDWGKVIAFGGKNKKLELREIKDQN